MPIWH